MRSFPTGDAGHGQQTANAPRQRRVNKVLQMPTVRERFADNDGEGLGGMPEEYDRIIRAELDKWGKVIRGANIRAD